MRCTIAEADGPFEIVWDDLGLPHVYAETVADAYRGMGFAAGSERLWQIHLSTLYANGEAASVLGERFVNQDAAHRGFNVPGHLTGLTESPGDWIADAYLQGLNAYIDTLGESPEEFTHAGASPRHFTREDIAARYRFTNWFQHRTWPEKLFLGRMMATHGTGRFCNHLLRFSAADAAVIEQLAEPLRALNLDTIRLVYPDMPRAASGSNNWAVTGAHAKSGKPMLATDPHQPHSIPNTFFYVHLHAGAWDVFGAAFPGVPWFMMGYTRELAWGLTTGFVDNYDVYVEELAGDGVRAGAAFEPLLHRQETIAVKGSHDRVIDVVSSRHGPLLENLTDQLGVTAGAAGRYQAAVRWALADVPTSAGALARLPLAGSAEAFGELLFESDVCPLVNSIICVDRRNNLRRFIAATLPVREGVTGMVPLPGWDARYDFKPSKADDLVVEVDPSCGFALTANNDTLGDSGPYPIHNFPTSNARADRIRQLLEAQIGEGRKFVSADFEKMQLDLLDLRAQQYVPDLIAELEGSEDADLRLAVGILRDWDCRASADAAGPCLFYPFLDRHWHTEFMARVLEDDALRAMPLGAPCLSRFAIADFVSAGSPWLQDRALLTQTVRAAMKAVVAEVLGRLGAPENWQWGALHHIEFWHSLRKQQRWSKLRAGPDPYGGSPTTLGMSMHMRYRATPDDDDGVMYRVYHGPSYRLVVDLADPDHCRFVIAGGNGGRPDSKHVRDHYATWLAGDFFDVSLIRQEITHQAVWRVSPISAGGVESPGRG